MVKMALNVVENYKNYTEITGIFDSRHIFDFSTSVENVPKYSTFDFWLSRYIFPKLLEFPKALSKRMALPTTHWGVPNHPFTECKTIIVIIIIKQIVLLLQYF